MSPNCLQATVESLGPLAAADRCQVTRIDESRSWLTVTAEHTADSTPSLSGRKFSFDETGLPESISLTFAGSCKVLVFSDGSEPEALREFLIPSGARHLLFPLYSNDRLSGFLSIHKSFGESFSEDVVELGEAICTELSTSGAEWSAARTSDDNTEALTRHLAVERSVRYVVGKLHNSLDRNNILQAAVDSVGHLLKASACMIVRTDASNSPVVTHEYVRPDISPLGLGDTSHVPARLVNRFHHRTATVLDSEVPDEGGHSWLGTPLIVNNVSFGVYLVRSDSWRVWQPHEIQLLEHIAQALCGALANAQAYQELREQLFNFKIISNLTQQLTSALDQIQRPGQRQPEVGQGSETPPISVPLSPREMEVLKLIAGGLANREIAQRLFLTESTVELHASRIRKKLKLKSRTALVKFACDNNLV
ncbi:MAG: LuxR C-terminal-related transcriptional regulator [Candidatus Obscuribacterales bacterium]|nr:LuxR C-terminal-related transcriptional regulator [Candidatus Obscuribacterales bacterium]